MSKKTILDDSRISKIVRRMAYEIYETNLDDQSLIFVGVGKNGLKLAEWIIEEIAEIDKNIRMDAYQLILDKGKPKETVELKTETSLHNLSVILVDDVINTGRTIAYGLMPILEQEPSKLEIAVLVDRGHRKFPVHATFTGYELSTTLEEHIEVKLGKKSVVHLY